MKQHDSKGGGVPDIDEFGDSVYTEEFSEFDEYGRVNVVNTNRKSPDERAPSAYPRRDHAHRDTVYDDDTTLRNVSIIFFRLVWDEKAHKVLI